MVLSLHNCKAGSHCLVGTAVSVVTAVRGEGRRGSAEDLLGVPATCQFLTRCRFCALFLFVACISQKRKS